MNVSHCLSSLCPGFNSRTWRSIARDFSFTDRTCGIGDEDRQVVTSPLKGYEAYKATGFFYTQVLSMINMRDGSKEKVVPLV